jgi:hypothetical protein
MKWMVGVLLLAAAVAADADRALFRSLGTLVFTNDGVAATRGGPPRPQMYQTGGEHIDVPFIVCECDDTCTCRLPRGTPASLEEYMVGCEQYDDEENDYILAGSCSVSYRLKPHEPATQTAGGKPRAAVRKGVSVTAAAGDACGDVARRHDDLSKLTLLFGVALAAAIALAMWIAERARSTATDACEYAAGAEKCALRALAAVGPKAGAEVPSAAPAMRDGCEAAVRCHASSCGTSCTRGM